MGSRGRYGKYGEVRRIERLRLAGTMASFLHESGSRPFKRSPFFRKGVYQKAIVKIRPAMEADTDFISQLSGKVFNIYGPYEDIVPKWFKSGMTTTIIAVMKKKPVGFAMIGNRSGERDLKHVYELLAIAVEPEKQQMGIGQTLMKDIERKAIELVGKKLFLHTAKENHSAQKLFIANGYSPYEIKRNFYPAGQDAVVMSREIG